MISAEVSSAHTPKIIKVMKHKTSIKVKEQNVSKVMFVQKLSERLGMDAKLVEKVFLGSLDLMVESIQEGNRIEFRDFFILDSKIQKSRMSHNPSNLEKIFVPERRVAVFKKGKKMRELQDIKTSKQHIGKILGLKFEISNNSSHLISDLSCSSVTSYNITT